MFHFWKGRDRLQVNIPRYSCSGLWRDSRGFPTRLWLRLCPESDTVRVLTGRRWCSLTSSTSMTQNAGTTTENVIILTDKHCSTSTDHLIHFWSISGKSCQLSFNQWKISSATTTETMFQNNCLWKVGITNTVISCTKLLTWKLAVVWQHELKMLSKQHFSTLLLTTLCSIGFFITFATEHFYMYLHTRNYFV